MNVSFEIDYNFHSEVLVKKYLSRILNGEENDEKTRSLRNVLKHNANKIIFSSHSKKNWECNILLLLLLLFLKADQSIYNIIGQNVSNIQLNKMMFEALEMISFKSGILDPPKSNDKLIVSVVFDINASLVVLNLGKEHFDFYGIENSLNHQTFRCFNFHSRNYSQLNLKQGNLLYRIVNVITLSNFFRENEVMTEFDNKERICLSTKLYDFLYRFILHLCEKCCLMEK